MKRVILIMFLLVPFFIIHSQSVNRDAFLGTWELKDKSNDVEIIKKDGLYYIVEFVRIKHELFFSGDNKRAIFQEWGKGPPGDLIGIVLSDDGKSIQYNWLSDFGEWRPGSAYIYYKK